MYMHVGDVSGVGNTGLPSARPRRARPIPGITPGAVLVSIRVTRAPWQRLLNGSTSGRGIVTAILGIMELVFVTPHTKPVLVMVVAANLTISDGMIPAGGCPVSWFKELQRVVIIFTPEPPGSHVIHIPVASVGVDSPFREVS